MIPSRCEQALAGDRGLRSSSRAAIRRCRPNLLMNFPILGHNLLFKRMSSVEKNLPSTDEDILNSRTIHAEDQHGQQVLSRVPRYRRIIQIKSNEVSPGPRREPTARNIQRARTIRGRTIKEPR